MENLIANLPDAPIAPLDDNGYNILVAGVGGTGVLTIGALLGMAAHVDGKGSTILDMTGMAQKGGSVTSHIRIGKNPESIYSSRLSEGMCDLVMACDLISASGAPVLKTVRPGHTAAILNTDVAPTGDFQTNKNLDLGEARLRKSILDAIDGGPSFDIQASQLATDLTGDSIGTNVLMMGYAAQKGLLPLSTDAIEEAIRLNGTFVKGNLRTFALGRLTAHDPKALAEQLAQHQELPKLDTVEDVLTSRTALLTQYQNEKYACEYSDVVASVRQRANARKVPNSDKFVRQVALTLAKLMAYKDEYEVARLYTSPTFWERLNNQFTGDLKLSFHLAPPLLPGKDASGRPKKRTFGPWVISAFKLLAKMKPLRGTVLDAFGYTAERRMERALIGEYRGLIDGIVDRLDQSNLTEAIALAGAAADIGGYGPVKEASVEEYRKQLPGLVKAFENPGVQIADPQLLPVQQV